MQGRPAVFQTRYMVSMAEKMPKTMPVMVATGNLIVLAVAKPVKVTFSGRWFNKGMVGILWGGISLFSSYEFAVIFKQ